MTFSSFSIALHRRLLRSLPIARLLAPTALLLALSLACGVGEGERLMTGMCPSGEVCSPAVRGLWFDGSSPEDHTLSAIALGGVERVEFLAVTPFGRDAAVGVDVDAGGPALPNFTVSSTSGVVQILASARRSDQSGEAALQGAAVGTATLRVTESASGALLDRIQVRVGSRQ